jgi:hypothetical protein
MGIRKYNCNVADMSTDPGFSREQYSFLVGESRTELSAWNFDAAMANVMPDAALNRKATPSDFEREWTTSAT